MTSMAEYLKKYTISDDGDGDKKKRRRKKNQGSSRGSSGMSRGGGGLRIIDDGEDTVVPDRKQVEKAWEDEEAEEEKPTLVVGELEEGKRVQSGSWTTVGGLDASEDDTSPPRRRMRHDSSDEDASPPRRNENSGSAGCGDASPPRRPRPNGRRNSARSSLLPDASPPRKRPMASGDDKRSSGTAGGRNKLSQDGSVRGDGTDSSPPRRASRAENGRGTRRRWDSAEGVNERDASPPRRKRSSPGGRDGRDVSPPRRVRDGAEGADEHDTSPPRRRRRHDSSDDDDPDDAATRGARDASPPRRSMKASGRESDASPPRRRRQQEDNGDRAADEKGRWRDPPGQGEKVGGGSDRTKTSSGYNAGLQSGKDFKVVEQRLRQKHESEMKAMDKTYSGQGAETVYRDKKGNKVDMLTEFKKQQKTNAEKKVEEAKDQFAWGRGKVQKEVEKQWKEELDNIAAEPFARSVGDARLEEMRKAEIRPDDPMAAYIAKKKSKANAKSGKPAKPEYKGPAPKPNRFAIRPGYRWDGVDRGNGWEDKIVAKGMDNQYKADLAYKWATADM